MATTGVQYARLELLRGLAAWYQTVHNVHERDVADGECNPIFCHRVPLCVPLVAGEWEAGVDDVLLAARECAALGEVDLYEECIGGRVERAVAITELGYVRIRIHDTIHDAIAAALREAGG